MTSRSEPYASVLGTAVPYLQCRCGAGDWQVSQDRLLCSACATTAVVEDGVLRFHCSYTDSSTEFYAFRGTPHFVNNGFAENIHVFAATRAYRRILDRWLSSPRGALLDLGCGDGRLSLWALEKGFSPVLALDANFESVRRLASTARERGLTGLIPVAAPMQAALLARGAFATVLCFEVLYYLANGDGRSGVLRSISSLLAPGGRLVLSEFTRFGRALADVVAMDMDNLRRTASHGTRREKYGDRWVEISHPTPQELQADCAKAGLQCLDKCGVSPIAMLFQHAYNFTSYPLRPALDAELQTLIEVLDDQSSEPSSLSRNLVLLLGREDGPSGR